MRTFISAGIAAAIFASLTPVTTASAASKIRRISAEEYVWVRVPAHRPKVSRKRYYSQRLYAEPVVIVERLKCQKLCMLDLSPCDPMEFKVADARCTNPMGAVYR